MGDYIRFEDAPKDEKGHIIPKYGRRIDLPEWVKLMALDIAATAPTAKYLAKKYNCCIGTINNWKSQKEFKDLVEQHRKELYKNTLDKYSTLGKRAVEVLAKILGWNPDTEEFDTSIPIDSDARQVAQDVVKGLGIYKQDFNLNVKKYKEVELNEDEEDRIEEELGSIFNDRKESAEK